MQKHGVTINTCSNKRNTLHLSLTTINQGVDDDPINDHQHFDDEIEVQLDRRRRYIKVWLAHAEPLVQQGLAEAAQTIVAGHLDICDYFYPPDMPPSPVS
jgi:hypothetical protein